MTTAYISHPACGLHSVPAGHPECPDRLRVISDELMAAGIFDFLHHEDAPRATRGQLLRVHTGAYIDQILALSQVKSFIALDEDTYVGPGSVDAALHAAGAAVKAAELVVSGRVANAFCAVRPPGHHAESNRAMGFCLFNNVAIGVMHALDGLRLERVAVLDFDAHYGNGTTALFAHESRVLVCSLYQTDLFPFMAPMSATKHAINTALAAGASGPSLRAAVEGAWLPALERFEPQMLFISAGFDGHREDDMSELAISDDDYGWLTERALDVARQYAAGRIVSVLEGGYELDALARSAVRHIRLLAGL